MVGGGTSNIFAKLAANVLLRDLAHCLMVTVPPDESCNKTKSSFGGLITRPNFFTFVFKMDGNTL